MIPLPAITNSFSSFFANQLCLFYFTMKISFLRLLLVLLVFSYFLSVTAIPARIRKLSREDSSTLPSLAQVDALNLESSEELQLERRIDLEVQDYGGTGANKDHDPKSPGRA